MRRLLWNATTVVVVQTTYLLLVVSVSIHQKYMFAQTCSLLLLFPSHHICTITHSKIASVRSFFFTSSPTPQTRTLCCFELRFCNSTCTTSNWLLCQKMHVSFSTFSDLEAEQFLPRFHFSSIRSNLSAVVRTILQRSGCFTTLNIWICTICWFFSNKI